MQFEYLATTAYQAEIEVPDIGNVAIKIVTKKEEEYGLLIQTEYGRTEIIEIGPLSNIDIFPHSCFCSLSVQEFSEIRIRKRITEFINKPKVEISYAKIVEKDEILKMNNEFQRNVLCELK